MNKPEVTIAVDGSLIRFHPRLKIILEGTLRGLIDSSQKVSCNFFRYFMLNIAFNIMLLI
jgi:hypothetical protein